MTTWSPDTCACKLEFRQGDKQPPTHIRRCVEHTTASGLDVWDENRSVQATLIELGEAGMDIRAVEREFISNDGAKRDLRVFVDRPIPARIRARIRANPHGTVTLVNR